MPIHKVAVTETLVRQLFELANTPFLLRAFRQQWETFGWSHQPGADDKFGFRLRLPNDLSMGIDPLGNQVISAILPFYHWEDYEPEWHEDLAGYER